MVDYITIIGGGLAGSEAAYQIAKRGIKVKLYEMKPDKFTEAHSNKNLAEIVCSNSFKSNLHTNACGLLKEELRKLVYSENVHTLLQDGLIKVAQGLTSFEEIIKLIELDVEDIVIPKGENAENNNVQNNNIEQK